MKRLAQGCSVLTVTALIVACASQQEGARDTVAETDTPPGAGTATPQVVPEMRVDQVSPRELEEIVVTGMHRQEAYELSKASAVGSVAPAPMLCCAPVYQQWANTERYEHLNDNPVHRVSEQPVSTFSIDVDTGAYANVRRFLNEGQLPPQDAVRVEEMINYFDYQYTPPSTREVPFNVATELANAPWNQEAWLLRIGIKGFEVPASQRPPANLVFLIDVSGSMQTPDKLPLLKNAFRLLTDQLTGRDRVSMVVYAGSSGVVLEPTPGDQKHKIHAAIDRLETGGSTNGSEGIERAYQLAKTAHISKGINRVVLATDGDFNVGVVDFEALVDMAEHQRASGVALTTLGFGTGNYNDKLLERLADAGNGNYAYVDSLSEARKVLVSELSATLFTIATDVKIQVEFNPAEVVEYRLIGYENRMLAREDFSNDKVDAGEIGAGHRITALYEVIPVGARGRIDPLRYGASGMVTDKPNGEIAHVRLRYKAPDGDTSKLLEYPIRRQSLVSTDRVSSDLRFAASVAAFGQLLRGGKYMGHFGYDDVESLAKGALDHDNEGYRREFVTLVKLAQSLAPQEAGEKVGQIGR
jgi:Ca-activated chloride channel homolog